MSKIKKQQKNPLMYPLTFHLKCVKHEVLDETLGYPHCITFLYKNVKC